MRDFDQLVPDMAVRYPFELDGFQKEAVFHLERGESVFVAAHTSAGKTVVAEYAIALARRHMTRAIYTSPIKALSNQKFRDFQDSFGDVGLVTGDVQLNQEASCLIVTTEILRSMLYKGADLLRDVEWVVFDEVHYVNDRDRGVVWEEVIIMLPAHVNLILLSATVPNALEFADWVGRTKRKHIFVVSTPKRPTPLEHFLCCKNELHKVVDSKGSFLTLGYRAAKAATEAKGPARPGAWRGGPQRSHWIKLVKMLEAKQLLPAVVFMFSKRRCEEMAYGLTNVDLTGPAEKSEIHVFIQASVSRLTGSDRRLPQVLRIQELLKRGIGVHHGGLLPIIKEMVEMLFARGLCRVLFATETFAMGVNMPARTVVFSSVRKHDGTAFRDLLPGEYTQMSGRAGRRGTDAVGTVIVFCHDAVPESSDLHHMLLGKAGRLESQFRLTYNMILNLLRVEDFKVEDMIKRSFGEVHLQRSEAKRKEMLGIATRTLQDIEDVECILGEPDIEAYYGHAAEALVLSSGVAAFLVEHRPAAAFLARGRVVRLAAPGHRNALAAVARQQAGVASLQVLVAGPQSLHGGLRAWELVDVPLAQVVAVYRAKISFDEHSVGNDVAMAKAADELARLATKDLPTAQPDKDLRLADWDLVDMWVRREAALGRMRASKCHQCPKLDEHFAATDGRRRVEERRRRLEYDLSDASLELMPEFGRRVRVLQRLRYIDEAHVVQLKGRVARELNTVTDELIATELVFDNRLTHLAPEEVLALLSCLIFEERCDSEPALSDRLQEAHRGLLDLAAALAVLQQEEGLDTPPAEYCRRVNHRLMEVVAEWARGTPFADLCQLTDVLEGSIVRCIVRLEEACREMRSAALIVGDKALAEKLELCSQLIKRDIVFASSLYVA